MQGKQSQFNSELKILIFIISMFIGIVCPVTAIYAQTSGTITGQVVESETKDLLPGANVMLEGTTFGDATDRYGKFRIPNVTPGNYNLIVRYIGYENYSTDVTVEAGKTTDLNIELIIESFTMDAILVEALAQGQVKALNQQKMSNNIKNVLSEELIKSFPDINSAEVLQRVPGVSITRDQGEGRYINIRGTESRMNSMTLNGQSITTPESDRRQVPLDIIPSNQLAYIEVVKAITPDMDGDAIGGAVNLITKSGLDYDRQVFSVTAGSGYNNLMGEALYQGSLTYANVFGENRNIGLMLGLSFSRSNMGSDNNEPEWGKEEDVNENEIPWALRNLELRDYQIRRERLGISGTLDFKPNDNSKLFIRGIYNKYDDDEKRRRFRIRPEKGDYVTPTQIDEAAFDRSLKDREQNQTLYNLVAGGEHLLGNWGLDYAFSYSFADEKEPDYHASDFELDEDPNITLDLSNTDLPKYTITNLENGYEFDPAHYVLDKIEVEDNSTSNRDITGLLNLKFPFLLGQNQSELKFGGKFLLKEKDQEKNAIEYSWEGEDDILLSQLYGDFEDTNFMGGEYKIGKTQDPQKVRDFVIDNKGGFLEGEFNYETDAEDYQASEDVFAFYGQSTTYFDKFMLLFGGRYEITNIEYTGYEVQWDEEGDYVDTTPTTSNKTWNHFLPSIHLKFEATPNTNIRAAFTSGLARPNFYDLVPFQLVFVEDEEMEIGNPDLEPTTSYNFDLLAEHFFQGIGVLSGGFFYKSLDKIIYPYSFEQSADHPRYAGYEVFQPIQGETATLYGFEMNWQQRLSFLPGFWAGFGIYINYTYAKSEATVGERKDIDLPGQAGNVGNAAINYQKYGFTAQVAVNFRDSYLETLGEDEGHDIYLDDHVQWDITASQLIFGGFRIFAQVNNISNAILRYYIGDTNRPIQREIYSWWLNAGINWDL